MAVKFLFFAQSAAWVRQKEMEVELNQPTPLVDLLGAFPQLGPILERQRFLRVAVNQEFSKFNKEVHDGDEIAFFPPFSGG